MTQFYEGQQVEVSEILGDPHSCRVWRNATIDRKFTEMPERYDEAYIVNFPNDTSSVVEAKDIRAAP